MNLKQTVKLIKAKLEKKANTVVLTEEDYENLPEEQKQQWEGYTYKMTYEIVTPESAEHGDAEERGWNEEGSEPDHSLEELLDQFDIHSNTWVEWSSSHPDGKHDWLISTDEEDYKTGNYTTHHLWIERADGKPLNEEELGYINQVLHLNTW